MGDAKDDKYLRAARESLNAANEKAAHGESDPKRANCVETDGEGDFICECAACNHQFSVKFEEADSRRDCPQCGAQILVPTSTVLLTALATRLVNPRVSPQIMEQLASRVASEEEDKSHATGCALLSALIVAVVAAVSGDSIDAAAQGGAIIGLILGVLVGVSTPNADGQGKFFGILLFGAVFAIAGALLSGFIAAIFS